MHILFFDTCIRRMTLINFIRSRVQQVYPMLTKVFYLSFFVFIYKQSLLNCPEAQKNCLPSAVSRYTRTFLLKLMLPNMTVALWNYYLILMIQPIQRWCQEKNLLNLDINIFKINIIYTLGSKSPECQILLTTLWLN